MFVEVMNECLAGQIEWLSLHGDGGRRKIPEREIRRSWVQPHQLSKIKEFEFIVLLMSNYTGTSVIGITPHSPKAFSQ